MLNYTPTLPSLAWCQTPEVRNLTVKDMLRGLPDATSFHSSIYKCIYQLLISINPLLCNLSIAITLSTALAWQVDLVRPSLRVWGVVATVGLIGCQGSKGSSSDWEQHIKSVEHCPFKINPKKWLVFLIDLLWVSFFQNRESIIVLLFWYYETLAMIKTDFHDYCLTTNTNDLQ